MDRLDRHILSILQEDGQIPMVRLSERVGLSLSACHRRVKIMEANGTISNYSAVVDRKAIGLELQVFIEVKLTSHYKEDQTLFEEKIKAMPDVLECHLISGEFDYLMRVAVSNPADYEDFYRNRLSQIPSISQVKTLLSLSTLKEFRGFNLELLKD
ncbi:Lrp/AsnC family transcriptional regulator [Roseovarius aestuarii]|uniref:Leucine-responsive regulatory protein n=1 Tax=Roseovarius aestuarii TaxID=475083 RepID=A0A1X7BP01_9RHOB|nr:Lrp/AsnC family transcriptional regulator [Roseovarius aestuarii]SMC11355.1 Leucine-responsive regulatory protein [Roseovarius aestuarii]